MIRVIERKLPDQVGYRISPINDNDSISLTLRRRNYYVSGVMTQEKLKEFISELQSYVTEEKQ